MAAAGNFEVTTSSLNSALSNLKTKRKSLEDKITALQTSEGKLNGKWEGDAKNEFEKAFNDDVKQMNSFVRLVIQYESSLQDIIDAYRDAETKNKSTATTRTSH